MIHLRNANMQDAAFLHRLRNDLETRANSHNTAPTSWSDHVRWLDWNLKDQFVKIYIGVIFDADVGTVRVEEESTGKLFSWTIAPEHRGKGYGQALVKAVANATGGRLKAEIKAGNIGSQVIAERAGFVLDYEKSGILYYHITPDGYAHDHLAVLRHL